MFSNEEVIRALYLGVFGREPDPDGMQTYLDIISKNEDALAEIAASLHESDEHIHVFDKGNVIIDHSQHGEFSILLNHFVSVSARHKVIVDVGARGRDRSNSYDLLKNFAWSGLLVEANPRLIDKISREFLGTNFKLLNCAVSDKEGLMPFYIGVNDDVSSLSKDSAQSWGSVRGQLQVEVFRIGRILLENRIPLDFDILSLDIEGFDVAVLNDMIENTQYMPNIIIIESSLDFRNKTILSAGMSERVDKLYELKYQTSPNMILIKK